MAIRIKSKYRLSNSAIRCSWCAAHTRRTHYIRKVAASVINITLDIRPVSTKWFICNIIFILRISSGEKDRRWQHEEENKTARGYWLDEKRSRHKRTSCDTHCHNFMLIYIYYFSLTTSRSFRIAFLCLLFFCSSSDMAADLFEKHILSVLAWFIHIRSSEYASSFGCVAREKAEAENDYYGHYNFISYRNQTLCVFAHGMIFESQRYIKKRETWQRVPLKSY